MRTAMYVGKAHRLDFHGTILENGQPTEVSDELASELSEREDVVLSDEGPQQPPQGETSDPTGDGQSQGGGE